jgi:hypothetical protein
VVSGALDTFWQHKKTLSPTSLLRALFTEKVLAVIRRDLHRKADVQLELEDIAQSLRRLLNPEVLTEDIKIRKAKKKRKRSMPQPDGQPGDMAAKTKGDESETKPVPGVTASSSEEPAGGSVAEA